MVIGCVAIRADDISRQTAIERLQLALPEQRYRSLAQGWRETISGNDLGVTLAAFEDLSLAPPEIRRGVLDQIANSSALPNLFASLSAKNRAQLVVALLPFGRATSSLQPALAEELRSLALTQGDLQYVSNMASLLSSQGQINDAIQAQLLRGISRTKDAQLRESLASVLIAHADQIGKHEPDVEAWLDSEPALRQLGLRILLRRRAPLSDRWVYEALSDASANLESEAMQYIHAVPAQTLDERRLKIIVPLFASPPSAPDWESAYAVLWSKRPELVRAFFQSEPARVADWTRLKPEILARILDVLPAEFDTQLASWKLFEGGQAKDAPFESSRANLSILWRRSRLGQDVSADLYKEIQDLQSNDAPSRQVLAGLVNRILATGPPMAAFRRLLSVKEHTGDFDNAVKQVAQLAVTDNEHPPRGEAVSPLIQAFAPVLASAVRSGETQRALDLMRMNTPVDPALLASDAVLSHFQSGPQLANDTALSLLAQFHRLPADMAARLVAIARDTSSPKVIRESAIRALSALDNAPDYSPVFLQIVQEPVDLPSAAALKALIPIYQSGQASLPLPSPKADWLLNATRDELARAAAADLFTVLSKLNKEFSPLLAQALGPSVTSYRCWDLSAADELAPEVWLSILDQGLRSPDRLDHARACVSILAGEQQDARPIALALNRENRLLPGKTDDRQALMSALTTAWPHSSGLAALRRAMANQVELLSSTLAHNPSNLITLQKWAQQTKAEASDASKSIADEVVRRQIVLALVGIPTFLLAHFALWLVLLFAYPYSPAVQSVVFWNRFVRKMLGLGYMDLVVLSFPFARQRIMAPFREQMLGEILQPSEAEADRIAYYPNGRVKRLVNSLDAVVELGEQPIVSALATLRGRTLLLGASGLGKSSFLRFHLMRAKNGRELAVYLPALRCAGGVEKAIATRIHVFSTDRDLLTSLIHAGRIEIYIDGYNEVDLATQEEITSFTATFSKAKILVASQIPLRGLSRLETLELQPLRPDEILNFLASRAAALPESATVRGEEFVQMATSYLTNLWGQVGSEEEKQAYELVLSNPMDLTTAAIVLGNGKEPNLLSLQEQQFQIMAQRHLKAYQTPFRTELFSEDVFTRRVSDDDDLTKAAFDREVASLVEEKMALVRTVDVRGRAPQQEIRFRHDRIRDYITHFAFLGDEREERRLSYARDSRFAGVFEYLARVLPAGPAERLREHLLMRAVETQDHRLSDSFIRQMSWRQQFAMADPGWMSQVDFPAAQQADLEFDRLQTDRRVIEQQMLKLRETMTADRTRTRILTTYDDEALLKLSADCLIGLGAHPPNPEEGALGSLSLVSPSDVRFSLAAVANRTAITEFQIELLAQRVRRFQRPVLVVTNSQTELPPHERVPDLSAAVSDRLRTDQIVVCSASQLYAACREYVVTGKSDFWFRGDIVCLTKQVISAPTGPA